MNKFKRSKKNIILQAIAVLLFISLTIKLSFTYTVSLPNVYVNVADNKPAYCSNEKTNWELEKISSVNCKGVLDKQYHKYYTEEKND